jgi:hypothetical protein
MNTTTIFPLFSDFRLTSFHVSRIVEACGPALKDLEVQYWTPRQSLHSLLRNANGLRRLKLHLMERGGHSHADS